MRNDGRIQQLREKFEAHLRVEHPNDWYDYVESELIDGTYVYHNIESQRTWEALLYVEFDGMSVKDYYIGCMAMADHPITCINPDYVFEIVDVQLDCDRIMVRGEKTCWFGESSFAITSFHRGHQ